MIKMILDRRGGNPSGVTSKPSYGFMVTMPGFLLSSLMAPLTVYWGTADIKLMRFGCKVLLLTELIDADTYGFDRFHG